MFDFENKYRSLGYKFIAGMDEAGRGPLAGPVCCAACIMPLDDIIEGVNDSKKLTEKKREELFDKIIEKAIAFKVSFVDEKTIDEINILEATKKGMQAAVFGLFVKPDFVLVDAVKGLSLDVPYLPIIKGDSLSYNIACASILAKVSRDRLMLELDKEFPKYNFKKHKGYGTKEHIENIKKYGKCPIHRNTFIKHFVGWKMNTKKIGDAGEKLAQKFLKKNKYKILQTNYRNNIGEIDIICFDKKEKILVFVEVKTKSTDFFGLPREMVDERKQEKIRKVATAYLMEKKALESDVRFDVLEVLDGFITHIKNAF